jgi:uncharacterized UBP type Zn finger protein
MKIDSDVTMTAPCEHTREAQIRTVARPAKGCEDCLKIGARWVHLRECLSCGHVGCCDQSTNKHATAHYRQTRHPIISSAEPGETWCWCYADARLLE